MTDLPDDPALPALAAIRTSGLAATLPALDVDEDTVEIRLCGYTEGSRATLDVRWRRGRVAVKAYADAGCADEAELYRALAIVGLRVPPLLTWDRSLHVLVLGWLDGTPLNQVIKEGKGSRAGELAGRWLWSAAAAPVRLGPSVGSAQVLLQAGKSLAALAAADAERGREAQAVAAALARTPPPASPPRLVHGTLYARHILDLREGDGAGRGPAVIDWQRFGQGPVELDAGVFLATLSRLRVRHPEVAAETARAEEAFLAETRGLLEERALRWYHAAALLHLSSRLLKRAPPAEAEGLLEEAAGLAQSATPSRPTAAALELVLQALSTRPATAEELNEIRRLLG